MPPEKNILSKTTTPDSRTVARDQEIDLLEVIFQLWQGKWFILIVMIFSLLLGSTWISLSKQRWESTAVVTMPDAGQIAYYSGMLNKLFPPTATFSQGRTQEGIIQLIDLQQQFFNRFGAAAEAHVQFSGQNLEISTSRLDKILPYPLSIKVRSNSANEAQKQLADYISTLNHSLVNELTAEIDNNINLKIHELNQSVLIQKQHAFERNQQRIEKLKQALRVAQDTGIDDSQLTSVANITDDTLYLLGTKALTAMISNESSQPLLFDKQYFDTQSQLMALNQLKSQPKDLQMFNYIKRPDLPSSPVGPKKKMIILLSLLLGFVAGSALVLGRNMLNAYRERQG